MTLHLTEKVNRQVAPRNKEELRAIVASHQKIMNLSLSRFSALALGCSNTLPRYFRENNVDIYFSNVDKVLRFIEAGTVDSDKLHRERKI